MRVLLTNDDGYQSAGLQQLCRALSSSYEVYVAAPAQQQSGASHSMHGFQKIFVEPVAIPGAEKAWAVSGTPVDSVKIGIEKLLKVPVDCVISGINQGANLGTDVFYSGTVGAACEAAIGGIPALAVSLDTHNKNADYQAAVQVASQVLQQLLAQAPAVDVPFLMNLNIPELPLKEIKGIRAAQLGVRRYHNKLAEQFDEDGRLAFLLGGICEELSGRKDDDVQLVKQGYASLTPLSLNRTDFHQMPFCRRITGENL